MSDNLLGLVYRIVQDPHPPITGERYSKDLKDMIDLLLQKDPEKRPSVREILKTDLIRRKAEEFINKNTMQRSQTIVYKKNLPIKRSETLKGKQLQPMMRQPETYEEEVKTFELPSDTIQV